MLVDAFLYAGERDLLELRMCELSDVVNLFVCVEGTLTFQGNVRNVATDLPRQANFTHIVVNDFPQASARNPWKREMYQRNAILRGLQGLADDDVVMLSDVDEIPEASLIPFDLEPDDLYRFQQMLYQFDFNNRVVNDKGAQLGWNNTSVCRVDDLRKHYPQGIRNQTDGIKFIQGGWHFSWFYNPRDKVNAYSHIELLQMEGTLRERIKARWHYEYEFVEGIAHLPICVQDDIDKYSKYFKYGIKENA